MTFQPTLESLIHRMELRHQHIEDELPEKERWGAGAYYRHELRLLHPGDDARAIFRGARHN